MGLTRAIGEFIAGTGFADLPPSAVPVIANGFTDCVGVLLAGWDEPVCRIVADGIAGPAAVGNAAAFLNVVAPAPDLALLYGAAAHALDFDDTGLSGHPSAVLVPAILAEAHDVRADGRAMIAAYAVGYEIWAELIGRDTGQHHSKGWHPTAVFGTLAAAGASAVLRGLSADQATHAIAIAASLAAGVVANFGSMTKPFQAGRAAQSGMSAARWAQRGLTAAPDAIEHPLGLLQAISPRGAVDVETPSQLATTWRISSSGLNFKLYPICYAAHRALDAMIDLCRTNKLRAGDIAQVSVGLGDSQAAMLRNHMPQAPGAAKFSLEFAMAAGAIAGRCGRSELTDDFILRRDVQDFFGKVTSVTTSAKNADEPSLAPFDRVSVLVSGGITFVSAPVKFPRGHFRNPVEASVLADKFMDCAVGALSAMQAKRLFYKLQDLASIASIADLAPDVLDP